MKLILHILHHHTKFGKDRSIRCGDITIFVLFKMDSKNSKIGNFNVQFAERGQHASPCQIFIKFYQTAAEIWQFNGFQHGGRPPSWIFETQIF